MVEHFPSSCEGIMPQVANFGDVFININVDGTSIGFVGLVVLCVVFRKCLKRLLLKLIK